MALTVQADKRLIRARGGSARHLRVRVTAPRARARAQRPPLNLALVIDRSGSMHGAKLDHAKAAAKGLVARLRDTDRLALVSYDSEVEVRLPSQPADEAAHERSVRAIERLMAGGRTALFDGWLHGCNEVARHLGSEQVARCLLLSDGLANEGLTDHDAIAAHVEALAARGVATSTFGVGADFDEELLARMAAEGRGAFYYIEEAAQMATFIDQELGEIEAAVARDTCLLVEAPEGAEVQCLGAFPVHREGGRWCVALGTLAGDQLIELVLRVELPAGAPGAPCEVSLELDDRDGVLGGRCAAVGFEYASDAAVDAEPHDREVAARAARVRAERARRAALAHNADGDWAGARTILEDEAARIRRRWSGDRGVAAIARELLLAAEGYARPMPAVTRKRLHRTSTAWLSSRDRATGAALRSGSDLDPGSTPH